VCIASVTPVPRVRPNPTIASRSPAWLARSGQVRPVPLSANAQTHARISKAAADVRTLASGVSLYVAHTGSLPSALSELTTTASNVQSVTSGPFVGSLPLPPGGGDLHGVRHRRRHHRLRAVVRAERAGAGARTPLPGGT
jgi:hypothetical protein